MLCIQEREALKTGTDKTLDGIITLRQAIHGLMATPNGDPRKFDDMVTLCDDLTRLEAKLRKL